MRGLSFPIPSSVHPKKTIDFESYGSPPPLALTNDQTKRARVAGYYCRMYDMI
jgi:hypothetical protein